MSEETTVMKTCPRCKRILPLTDKYFPVANKEQGRYHSACRECKNYRARELSAMRKGREINTPREKTRQDGMKKCNTCGKLLPATNDYFDLLKTGANGLRPSCKECRGYPYNTEESREKFQSIKEDERRRREEEALSRETKTCARCGRELPANIGYFWGNSRAIDGLQATCIECKGGEFKPGRQHREVANEKLPEGMRHCLLCGEDLPIESFRAYERKRAGGRVIIAHTSYCFSCERLKVREYQREHPQMSLRQYYMRKALYCDNMITLAQWEETRKYFGNRCAYCGKRLPLEMDHITPASKGGRSTPDNIVPACRSCNSSKGAKPFVEWYRSRPFYSEAREFNIMAFVSLTSQRGTENAPRVTYDQKEVSR